jgi:DNA-binding response OmpR family regulator
MATKDWDKRKMVLVIEDDYAILDSLQFLLEDAGYAVMLSEDGTVIDSKFKGKKPDLILLDYWLPNHNGGELTKKLKSADDTKQIPVLVISASYNIKDHVLQAGADEFIPKPYDIYALLERIDYHLN